MATVIQDPELSQQLIAERQRKGLDRYDEVWEGVYIMAPWPNDEQQELVGCFSTILGDLFQFTGRGKVRPGVNLAADPNDWKFDFRVPDVILFLNGTRAELFGSFWSGAADFVIEITSPRDDTRAKLPFYEKLGIRELLVIDRKPWQLELYRHERGKLSLIASATPGQSSVECGVVPLRIALRIGKDRPEFSVEHTLSDRKWTF